MRRSGSLAILLVALLVALSSPTAGRSQQATTVQVNTVDASAYPTVKATVTVLDGTQRPVLNLPLQVVQSMQQAQSGSSLPRRAVVLLTDGADFGGVSSVDSAGSLSQAGASGIPFFTVGLGSAIDQPYLQQLADTTRGQLSVAPAPESLT